MFAKPEKVREFRLYGELSIPSRATVEAQMAYLNSKESLGWLREKFPEVYERLDNLAIPVFFDYIDPHVTESEMEAAKRCPAMTDIFEDGSCGLMICWSESFSNFISLSEMIRHELVHVDQIRSGRLKMIPNTNSVMWLGEKYEVMSLNYQSSTPTDEIVAFLKYYSQPWEYEAFAAVASEWVKAIHDEFGTLWMKTWDEVAFRASLDKELNVQKAITAALR